MEFHLLRPYWLIAIIPALFLFFLLRYHFRKGDNWQKIIDPGLLPFLLNQSKSARKKYSMLLLFLFWLIAVFALSGPTWNKQVQPLYKTNNSKILVLDLSSSMLATDIPPNRLTRARYKVIDILKNYREGQTGMVVFTNEAYTVSPLTSDTQTIALMVPDLSPDIMPISGNNIGAGLLQAQKLLQQAQAKQGDIILLTASMASASDDAIASQIHKNGYDISVLGMASDSKTMPQTLNNPYENSNKMVLAQLDVQSLEQLATDGGGKFSSFTNDENDINYLLSTSKDKATNTDKTKQDRSLWLDQGRWFVLLLMLLLLFAFRKGWLVEQLC